mgnify:FL=1
MIKFRIKNSQSGMILLSTTMGVFVILSIFAFYLARFSITENRSSGYYIIDIKARSLALSGLNHSLELFKVNRGISNTSGRINKGEYIVSKIPSKNELDENLSRTNYFTLQSTAKIGEVERKVRCVVSSLPEAFCFVFYGNNNGDETSSLSTASLGNITGDVFFRGNISSENGSDDGVNYSSTGVGGTVIENSPPFPIFDDTYFNNFLNETINLNNANTALDLNGENISISNHSDINEGEHATRTIELWFKVDNKSTGSKQTLYEEGGTTRGLNIYINSDGALYGGGWNRNESEWMGDWINTNTTDDIVNGQWHHVALVLNGSTSVQDDALTMYLDGELVSTVQGSQLWQHGANIKVGKNGNTRFKGGSDNSSGEYFYGSIDEFRIWNVARSSQNIALYKDSFLNGNEIELTTYFDFEDQTADDVQTFDSKNNGTISSNSVSWVSGPPLNISFENEDIDLTSYSDSILYINGDVLISNCSIIGPGKIVVNGGLTINSNSEIGTSNSQENHIYFISEKDLTITGCSSIGSDLKNYVIAYSRNKILIENINKFYGLIISKGSECVIKDSEIFGALYSESSTIDLKENTIIRGSIVSKYSINILDGTVSLTKDDLPLFINQNIGLEPFIIPGSYLEY